MSENDYQYDNPDADKATETAKNAQPEPETVAPEQPAEVEGVQTGDLRFVPNVDGTRFYGEQKAVETIDDPTPTPAEDSDAPEVAQAERTNEPVGH